MIRPVLLAASLTATLIMGAGPALAADDMAAAPVVESADGWKVMSPVELEAAAEAALPKPGQPQAPTPGGGAGAAPAPVAEAPTGAEAPAAPPAEPAAPAAEAAPAAAPPKPAAPSGPAYLQEDQPFQLKDYEEPKPQAQAPWWQQALGFALKLLLVLGLIAGSLAATKKLSGGRLPLNLPLGGAKGRNLAVIESTSLGPQQAIHLVSVGGDRLLVVGAGPQGLTTLATIDDPSQVRILLAATNQKGSNSPFNQVFDLETVVQDGDADMFRGRLSDLGRRGGWGG